MTTETSNLSLISLNTEDLNPAILELENALKSPEDPEKGMAKFCDELNKNYPEVHFAYRGNKLIVLNN